MNTTTPENGQNGARRPPALGDVEIRRDGPKTWALQRNGETLARGLDFATVTAIIRGELAIEDLQQEANGPIED